MTDDVVDFIAKNEPRKERSAIKDEVNAALEVTNKQQNYYLIDLICQSI